MLNCKFAVLAIVLFLAGCAAAVSDGDGALVVEYTAQFQAAVADEYEALPVSCQPNDATTPPGCSAVKTLLIDYGHLRARLRAE